MAKASLYDAIVLDVMLPGLDGFATCRELRAKGVWTPVLMLTARDAVDEALKLGRVHEKSCELIDLWRAGQ